MKETSPLSPAQSHYVLSRLIEDKKISTRDVVSREVRMRIAWTERE